jgi:hypothetical protein
MDVIAEMHGNPRQHPQKLYRLLTNSKRFVRVASAYVTDSGLLSALVAGTRRVQLLTSLLRMDVITGATSLDALANLIEAGVDCRCLSTGPRLHAKVYIVDDESAVVTSANLTVSALRRNIEVGIGITGNAVPSLVRWYSDTWARANPLDLAQIAQWRKATDSLRRRYLELQKKADEKRLLPNETPRGPADTAPLEARPAVSQGPAKLWRDYRRHFRNHCPSDDDRDVSNARSEAEKTAAAWSKRLGGRLVYLFAYFMGGKAAPIRFSISKVDPPEWPRPPWGRVEKLSVWRSGGRVKS